MSKGLGDLDAVLFDQLNRLNNDNISQEKLDAELARADGITQIAAQIVKSADIKIKAANLFGKHGHAVVGHLPLVGSSDTSAAQKAIATDDGENYD